MRDSAQLPLHQIEKLVQTLAQNCRYVDRSEDAAQAIELFGGGIAVAQRVMRLDFAEQPAGLAYAMMQRTWKGLVEQQETGHTGRGRAGRVQAPPAAERSTAFHWLTSIGEPTSERLGNSK